MSIRAQVEVAVKAITALIIVCVMVGLMQMLQRVLEEKKPPKPRKD